MEIRARLWLAFRVPTYSPTMYVHNASMTCTKRKVELKTEMRMDGLRRRLSRRRGIWDPSWHRLWHQRAGRSRVRKGQTGVALNTRSLWFGTHGEVVLQRPTEA